MEGEKMDKESLSQRVTRGGVWVFARRITERIFSLIKLIILARILAPRDFGLMGIALLTMATLETFSRTGFEAALIQRKDNAETYLDAVWTVLVLRGVGLFAILFFIAPYAAIFFKAPQAKLIIQVVGFSFLLRGFTNIGMIYFQKELEFNKQFIHRISTTLADFVVAVSAVLILRSVWALVLGSLAGAIVGLIVSYLIHPYRPHFNLDLRKAKELFGFGKWIFGSSILIFLFTQGDDIFVGKLLGVAALGFYQMAYRLSNLPTTEIAHVVSQVTFPAYSKLQDNLRRLKNAYLKVLQLVTFISIPLAGGIFILAPDFTKIFLGEKWMPMVAAMRILCIFGAIRSILNTYAAIYAGVRKPKIGTRINFFGVVTMAAIIYPLTSRWGILGTAWAVVIPMVFSLALGTWEMHQILKLDYFTFTKITLLPVIAISIFGFFYKIKNQLWCESSLMWFFALVILGGIIYFIMAYLIDKLFRCRTQEALNLFLRQFRLNKGEEY